MGGWEKKLKGISKTQRTSKPTDTDDSTVITRKKGGMGTGRRE